MRASRPLLLTLVALTAGCADPEPFVEVNHSYTPSIGKPVDPVVKTGRLTICFSDATPWEEVMALAQERCATHGLLPYGTISVMRWQCRVTSPHLATFSCYDPDMVMPGGRIVNPFRPMEVQAWERATGRKAKPHNFMTTPDATAPAGEVAPRPAGGGDALVPPQPPAPAAPPPAALGPADIAGKPQAPIVPYRSDAPPPPPPAPLPPEGGFTLPQGSWGDHFQD